MSKPPIEFAYPVTSDSVQYRSNLLFSRVVISYEAPAKFLWTGLHFSDWEPLGPLAKQYGWTVVSMKNEWKTVFA